MLKDGGALKMLFSPTSQTMQATKYKRLKSKKNQQQNNTINKQIENQQTSNSKRNKENALLTQDYMMKELRETLNGGEADNFEDSGDHNIIAIEIFNSHILSFF